MTKDRTSTATSIMSNPDCINPQTTKTQNLNHEVPKPHPPPCRRLTTDQSITTESDATRAIKNWMKGRKKGRAKKKSSRRDRHFEALARKG